LSWGALALAAAVVVVAVTVARVGGHSESAASACLSVYRYTVP